MTVLLYIFAFIGAAFCLTLAVLLLWIAAIEWAKRRNR